MRYLRTTNPHSVKGTALVRLDFNTQDEWRMEATASTLRHLKKTSEKVVIMSHRGRPTRRDARYSLKKDAKYLSKLLKTKVKFIPHFRWNDVRRTIARAPKRSIFLLENLRFMKGEEANDKNFARELASLGNFYVNDAFAVSHRDAASVDAITRFLPSYVGLELEKEIRALSRVAEEPKKPLVIIVGGAKAHDKLGVMKYFHEKADYFLLGGGPANTMMSLQGLHIGKSVADKDPKDLKELKRVANYGNVTVPVDWKMHEGRILDIGEWTIRDFVSKIRVAKTIFWNGPMGLIEKKPFDKGTMAIAQAITENKDAFSIAGGGETVMFLKAHKLDKKFGFISTGGSAMLDFLAGETLPGLAALKRTSLAHPAKRMGGRH